MSRNKTTGGMASAERSVLFLCPEEEDRLIEVIIEEMGKGNFSFLILVVGIIQLAVMIAKRR